MLLSSTAIATEAIHDPADRQKFIRERRPDHVVLSGKKRQFSIRDQRPISMVVLERSLTPGWTAADFIELLNGRVFFWPTINRLTRHFERYSAESPVIIRVESQALLDLNAHVEFACLNTGATRCHPKYGGNAPTRGDGTFQSAKDIRYPLSAIAEVTFPVSCLLPQKIWIGKSPDGLWETP